MIMTDVDRVIAAIFECRVFDLHKLMDGYAHDLPEIVAEIMNRGIDSMLTDLELSEGQRWYTPRWLWSERGCLSIRVG